MNLPRRPALRYYGGKFAIGKWIISYFPEHNHYAEPCFGAGNVLLQKQPAKLETVNDLNRRVVNYFRVLRDQPDELIEMLRLTPWAKDEYNISSVAVEDPLEDARRFHISCWMSMSGGPETTGFRSQNKLEGRSTIIPADLTNHDLLTVSERLRNVQVLNEDAIRMISRYKDVEDVLIYFDPPYIKTERTRKNGYGDYEVDEAFHIEAAERLREVPGHVIVSGYACELYDDLYSGWRRIDRDARTNSGSTRTESLWLSPKTWHDTNRATQVGLFS